MTDEQREALAAFVQAAVLVNYHGPVRGNQWKRLADAQSALCVVFSVTPWDLPFFVTESVRAPSEPKA